MVKLRLRRAGKKKQPVYTIVAADSRAARSGKYIEALGQYNPRTTPTGFTVDERRLFSWLKRGAQPSDTLRSLLRRNGLWLKWDLVKKGADDTAIAAELEKWQALQAEKQQRETERRERRKAAKKKKAAESAVAAVPATPAVPPNGGTEAPTPAA